MCGRLALDGITHPRCKTNYCIDGLTTFFHYDGIIRKAIKAIKYRNISDLAQEFISIIPEVNLPTDSIIPIPLHVSRFRQRGFNQAEVLGKFLAQKKSMPLRSSILFRNKKTTPQVEMKDRKERLKNMEHVFEVRSDVLPAYVLLFDDVYTTGATMRSAARELKKNGVMHVWAMTMAR